MKKIVFVLFAFSFLWASAQNKGTIESRALMQTFNNAKSVDKMPQKLLDRYPIIYHNGVATIGATAKVTSSFDAQVLERQGIKVTSRIATIIAMRVPLDKLHVLQDYAGIESFSVAHRVAPMMDRTRTDTRTDSVQAGLGLPMPFNGEGVLVGITDWGFDYNHPNINKKNNMRIDRAWDQFKLSGPAPDGFDYGTEYATPDEVYAAKCDTSGLYGYGTHGTHVAGILGGNGTSDGHVRGQAPGVHFLLGSWYLDEPHWLDQAAWMKRVADEQGKRLVINGSWGMYTFSTLDGSSHLSQAINHYTDSGIVFVTSGGNNGDTKFHIQHSFTNNDTINSIATYLSSGIGEALIFWGEPADGSSNNQFEAGFALYNNSTSQLYRSPLFSTSNNIDYLDTFLVAGNDTISYDIMVEQSNILDQRPHILLNVSKNNKYKLIMTCTADSGVTVNVWNVGNVKNKAGNAGCDFQSNSALHCMGGDRDYGIGEPACAEKTISVAAHNSDYYLDDSTYIVGGIADFSSHGPTLDGRNKPEISAPGANVISSLSSWRDGGNYQIVYTDRSGGRNYQYAALSGTSMSSPAVSGVVALMLQANPYLTVDEVREIIFSTARNDRYTGPLQANDSISPTWGHGKIDALRAVGKAYERLSIEHAAKITPRLVVYPSPASSHITILTGNNATLQTSLFSADGRCLMQFPVSNEKTVDISTLPKGIYFVRVQDPAGVRTAKFVK